MPNSPNKLKDNGHSWIAEGEEVRCRWCDTRPSGRFAQSLCIKYDLERMQGAQQ